MCMHCILMMVVAVSESATAIVVIITPLKAYLSIAASRCITLHEQE